MQRPGRLAKELESALLIHLDGDVPSDSQTLGQRCLMRCQQVTANDSSSMFLYASPSSAEHRGSSWCGFNRRGSLIVLPHAAAPHGHQASQPGIVGRLAFLRDLPQQLHSLLARPRILLEKVLHQPRLHHASLPGPHLHYQLLHRLVSLNFRCGPHIFSLLSLLFNLLTMPSSTMTNQRRSKRRSLFPMPCQDRAACRSRSR